jgi:GntR family transcriptional regulator of arabinose operon
LDNKKYGKVIKHQQIYDDLCRDILSGVYKPGQNLPTEKELAKHFKASRPTIAKAMRELQHKGLIVRRQGQGTFVQQAKTVQKKTLGLLVHWQIWPQSHQVKQMTTIFGLMIPEMLRVASQFNYSLLLNDIPEDIVDPVERARSICQKLVDANVGGVFFTPLELEDDADSTNEEIATMLNNAGIPIVLLDRDITDSYHRSKYDIVGINNEQSSLVLTHHLIDLGCSKIDFISSPSHTTSIVERIRGYHDALEENDILFDSKRVHFLQSKFLHKAENEQAAQEMIRLVKENKTEAFVCVNDDTAGDMIKFFLRNGIRIPEDVRVVGFDDLPTNQYLPVSLTTIRQPVQSLAIESIRTMRNRINNLEMPSRDILLKTELIVRESCGSKL